MAFDSRYLIVLSDESIAVDLSRIMKLVYLRPADVVLLSGTLVEGIGNVHSDFDVYVICSERPEYDDKKHFIHSWVGNRAGDRIKNSGEQLFSIHDYYNTRGTHIDVEYWTYAEVDALIEKVYANFIRCQGDMDRKPGMFNESENNLLHRLFVGKPLHNRDGFMSLLSRLPKTQFCYLAYREIAFGFWGFKDIIGGWHAGDLDLAFEVTREYLITQSKALTHLFFNTNKNRKWVLKKVEGLGTHCREIQKDFRALLFRGARSDDEKRAFVLESMGLLDNIVLAMGDRLDSVPDFPSRMQCLTVLEDELANCSVNHAQVELEKTFRRSLYTLPRASFVEFLES